MRDSRIAPMAALALALALILGASAQLAPAARSTAGFGACRRLAWPWLAALSRAGAFGRRSQAHFGPSARADGAGAAAGRSSISNVVEYASPGAYGPRCCSGARPRPRLAGGFHALLAALMSGAGALGVVAFARRARLAGRPGTSPARCGNNAARKPEQPGVDFSSGIRLPK